MPFPSSTLVLTETTLEFDFDAQFEEALYHVMATKFLVIDTEATGLLVKDGRSHCIGISVAGRTFMEPDKVYSYYFPLRHDTGNISKKNEERLFSHLRSRTKQTPVIYHNAKYDLYSMLTIGLDMRLVYFYDTMMMAHLLNENYWSKTLDWLSKNVCKNEGKRKPPLFEHCMNLFGWSSKFPAAVMGWYATGDTERTLELFEKFFPKFLSEGFNAALES
jgi:DNA polymerase I-like protein with 3'-5' exonuclease and polymerase domains